MFDNVKKENHYKSSNVLFEKPPQSRMVDTRFTGEIMVHLKIYNLSIGTGALVVACEEVIIIKGISKIDIRKGKIMTIVSNNSLLFNMEMDFWKFNGFDTEGLLGRWCEIYDLARENHTEDATFFLAECMDVLCEKVLSLPDSDRIKVLDKANEDMNAYEQKHRKGAA